MFVRLSYSSLISGGFDPGNEHAKECGERTAAMAEGEFGEGVEFGHGRVAIGQIEEWVVAEAAGAAWGGENFAFDGAVADAEDLSVARRGEGAVVAGFVWAGGFC